MFENSIFYVIELQSFILACWIPTNSPLLTVLCAALGEAIAGLIMSEWYWQSIPLVLLAVSVGFLARKMCIYLFDNRCTELQLRRLVMLHFKFSVQFAETLISVATYILARSAHKMTLIGVVPVCLTEAMVMTSIGAMAIAATENIYRVWDTDTPSGYPATRSWCGMYFGLAGYLVGFIVAIAISFISGIPVVVVGCTLLLLVCLLASLTYFKTAVRSI